MNTSAPLSFALLSGCAHAALSQAIATHTGLPLLNMTNHRFADGEIRMELHDNVRNQNVFIVQPTCPPVNDHVMELAMMADMLKRASAKHIVAVMPYFGYARQDRKAAARAPISAKLVANLLTAAGVERILTLDLHAMQIQGFFDIPVDHLYASPLFEADIRDKYKQDNLVIVSPDAGGMRRTRALATRLDVPLAMVDKRRDTPNQATVSHLIGDVTGKTCLVFDDMVDTGGTICAVADMLKEHGAKKVIAYVTHGLFSDPAPQRLAESSFDDFVVTDSVPLRDAVAETGKVRVIPTAAYIAEAMRRITTGESLSALYDTWAEETATN